MKKYNSRVNIIITSKDNNKKYLIEKNIINTKVKLNKLRKKRLIQILVDILYYYINDSSELNDIIRYINTCYEVSLHDILFYRDR